jgi:CDP-glucose 4,6-dehydratase
MEHLERMPANRIEPSFWNGRRVFVTGHTGFMGGWLCLWLNRLGAEIAGYALPPPTQQSLFEITALGERLCSIIADIRDLECLTAAMTDFKPDIVLHLAAQPLVGTAHGEPVETFGTNVMGTVNVLQAIRSAPSVEAALIVTTDKVYDNQEWAWGYRECDPLGGHEPYGASKACAEIAVEAFRQSYFSDEREIGIATIRAGNIIGGGDFARSRLIPDAIRAFSAGNPLTVRNPSATRPWQHVLDPLRGYLMLGQRLTEEPAQWSGPWNFGPAEDDALPVSTIAEELIGLWGNDARWQCDEADAKPAAGTATFKESHQLVLSSSQAARRLEWRPVWRIQRALSATVEWYKAHVAQQDMYDFSMQQISLVEGTN